MQQDELIGISPGEHRITALFCDRVLPLHSGLTIPEEIKYNELYSDLKQGRLQGDFDIMEKLQEELRSGKAPSNVRERDEYYRRLLLKFENSRAAIVQQALAQKNVRSIPFFTDEGAFEGFINEGNSDCLEIKIAKAPIIDVEKLTWEHIIELRKDPDVRKKLRNFRVLLYEDYRGKDISYVTDSLLKKLDEYEETCKNNGVKLVLSSFHQVLDSKSILGTLGLITAGILTGNPIIIAASTISGTAIELGKLSIQIAQKKIEFNEIASRDGVAYLMDIRRKTTNT
jgi:hypothetical protein